MSDVLDRFLGYVQIGSESKLDNFDQTPSTACQFDMANKVANELREIGCADVKVDEHAYVARPVRPHRHIRGRARHGRQAPGA